MHVDFLDLARHREKLAFRAAVATGRRKILRGRGCRDVGQGEREGSRCCGFCELARANVGKSATDGRIAFSRRHRRRLAAMSSSSPSKKRKKTSSPVLIYSPALDRVSLTNISLSTNVSLTSLARRTDRGGRRLSTPSVDNRSTRLLSHPLLKGARRRTQMIIRSSRRQMRSRRRRRSGSVRRRASTLF